MIRIIATGNGIDFDVILSNKKADKLLRLIRNQQKLSSKKMKVWGRTILHNPNKLKVGIFHV